MTFIDLFAGVGGFGRGNFPLTTLEMNTTRDYKTFEELHGVSLEDYKEGK